MVYATLKQLSLIANALRAVVTSVFSCRWNPAVELQALNRVHRIGQEKPVFVKRFIVKDTVEENMLKIQDKKQALVTGALATTKEEQQAAKLDDLKLFPFGGECCLCISSILRK